MLKNNYLSRAEINSNKSAQKKNSDAKAALFAAGVVHELGNPLDAIRRYVNLALDNSMGDPLTREYLLKAKQGIFQTMGVMNKLLTYSRQYNDSPPKQVEIHDLLERSLHALSEEEKFKGISIHKNFCQESMYVEDRGLLIVLHNLYKNAAQAMKGNGTLTVATWRQNGSVGVVIQDTGEGIPETIKERIFEPFFSTKNRDEGTGIGLALSHEIVERCGGELRFENVSEPNPGARFTFVLPRKTSGPAKTDGSSI